MAALQKAGRVVVYGGKGALGSACVKHFKSKDWWVGSIDLKANEEADANVVVTPKESWNDQFSEVSSGLEKILGDKRIDALICVAGGWTGGNAASDDLVINSDKMWKQSVWPAVISAGIGARYLNEGGLLSLPGAKAALGSTPGMIGYGIAKAAVHHLVISLAGKKSGLPKEALVVGILPVTLDTPANRDAMPGADFSKWTPTSFVAELLYSWASKMDRPENGKLVLLVTDEGKTSVSFA